MKKQLLLELLTVMAIFVPFASLLLLNESQSAPTVFAQYSWSDSIKMYRQITAVEPNLRSLTNEQTFPVDVRVYLTSVEQIGLLKNYRLYTNNTDFVIIKEGVVIRSENFYRRLQPLQTLSFNVLVEPSDTITEGQVLKLSFNIELYKVETAIPEKPSLTSSGLVLILIPFLLLITSYFIIQHISSIRQQGIYRT